MNRFGRPLLKVPGAVDRLKEIGMQNKSLVNAVACLVITVASSVILMGCVVYQPVPASAPAASSFDRSWNAAVGAMQDVGVRIQSEDRARGVITGANDSRNVTVTVVTQADGSVRMEISARGPQGGDSNLANDISRAYDRRMGR
jgi:hypothetical protein